MKKEEILRELTALVESKHPWRISQEKYISLFGRFPEKFLEERSAYDALIEKCKNFVVCNLVLSQVKVEVKLTLDELIEWELHLDRWEEARAHDIRPHDIKKLIKQRKEQ